jgi:hypothetical protein
VNTTQTGVVRDITDAEVAAYQENGWAHLPSLISPDLAAEMLSAAKRLMGEDGRKFVPRAGIDPTPEWSLQYHYAAYEQIDPFGRVGLSAEVGRAARRLMTRDVSVRYYRDLIVCRQPRGQGAGAAPTLPHQDYPSRIFDRSGYVNFWIALNEVPPERGSLQFLSGSHHEGPLGWDDKEKKLEEQLSLTDTYPEIFARHEWSAPLHLRPGDATCHGMLTVHRAPENATDEQRWSWITMYIPEDTRYVGNPEVSNLIVGNPSHVSGVTVGPRPGDTFDHPHFPLVPDSPDPSHR